MSLRVLSGIFALVCLTACTIFPMGASPWATTAHTSKHVERVDIAGLWQYDTRTNGKDTVVTVELEVSGTFTITGSGDYDGFGRWSITSNNSLSLEYQNVSKIDTTWYVTDESEHNFAVIGGDGDPDFWTPMRKVR